MRDSPPRKIARSLTACDLAVRPLRLQRRQAEDHVLAGERPAQVALERLALDGRQEADAAVVDADHRGAGPRLPRERAEDAAVAAEDEDQVLAARAHLHAVGR